MYISKLKNNNRFAETNDIEFRVWKKVFEKLIFNPEGVSNQFKLEQHEIMVISKMRTQLNAER